MIGPVLQQELLLGSRRNNLHVFRWIYAGWLVVLVLFFYMQFAVEASQRVRMSYNSRGAVEVNSGSAPEVVGMRFAQFYVVQQVILLLLITPPFVAGAVTDEKRRGTLQHLLLTDLEARHIILGKILGRVALVGLIFLAGFPLFGLLAGFGGVEPVTLLILGASLVIPLFGLASATMLASVWCKQTRDAVIALYLLGIVGAIIIRLVGGPLDCLNPLFVVEPAWGPTNRHNLSEVGWRFLLSAAGWSLIIFPCLAIAILRLRPTYARELEGERPQKVTWYSADRPPIGAEPVRWREKNVEGLAPNPLLRRIPSWLGITVIALGTVITSTAILYFSFPQRNGPAEVIKALLHFNFSSAQNLLPDASLGFTLQSILVMLIASLVVGIRCSGAVTTEREKQTWEALLLTPLSARSIIAGKLWGVMEASTWFLVAYAAPALILSTFGGFLAFFYTVIGLGVTLLAMYFIGATGIWCSVTSKGSWRSLLKTLVIGYLGGLILFIVTSPLIGILYLMVILALAIVDKFVRTNMAGAAWRSSAINFRIFVLSTQIALAIAAYLLARLFLYRSLRWVADRERTRHWHDEPLYVPRRRNRDRTPFKRQL